MKYEIEDSCGVPTLAKLVELYSKGKGEVYLYYGIIDDSENENENAKHLREFTKWIKRPSYIEFYNNYRNIKLNDKSTEESLKKFLMKYKDYMSITPFLSKDLYNFYILMIEYKNDPKLKTKVSEEIKRLEISREDYNDIWWANKIDSAIFNRFHGDVGTMGFHVNPNFLYQTNEIYPDNGKKSKFYINAGYDTYKFAKFFQDKCKQRNLNYYFKVVDSCDRYEETRSDKLCIYTKPEDAEKFLQIILEVRDEHQEIKYRKPPLTCFYTIDKFIGIGIDMEGEGTSYNSVMSQICFQVMEKLFKGIPKQQLMNYVKQNPSLLITLKDEIMQEAIKFGIFNKNVYPGNNSNKHYGNSEPEQK